MANAITSLSAAQLPAPEAPKPKNAAEASRQFEAILIAQMLRSARGASSLSGGEEDSTSGTMWDLAVQQFSQLLAEEGGLGLARVITRGLEKASQATSTSK